MSTDYEINQQERVQNERFRRSSFAQLVHDRARGKDGNTFTPEYDDKDPHGLDPTNLASALGEKYMPYYTQLVRIEPPQAEPTIQAPLSSMSAPRLATATGGDGTTDTKDPDGLDPTNLASGLGEEDTNFYTQLVRIEPPQAEPTIQAPLSSMSAPRPATATGGDATTGTLQALGQTLIGCINPSTSRRVKTVAQAFGQYEITNWSRPRGFDSGRSLIGTTDTKDPDRLDPTNLASGLGEEDMNFYTQLVRIEPPQAEPTIQAPLSSMSAPRPATATGGDATTGTLQSLMRHIISNCEDEATALYN